MLVEHLAAHLRDHKLPPHRDPREDTATDVGLPHLDQSCEPADGRSGETEGAGGPRQRGRSDLVHERAHVGTRRAERLAVAGTLAAGAVAGQRDAGLETDGAS